MHSVAFGLTVMKWPFTVQKLAASRRIDTIIHEENRQLLNLQVPWVVPV